MFGFVEDQMHHGAAAPPSWIIVERRDLLQFAAVIDVLVVVGADPGHGIERAGRQRRHHLAACRLLGHGTEFLQDPSRETPRPDLEPGEVGGGLDVVAKETAHLGSGIAGRKGQHAVVREERIGEVVAAPVEREGSLLARIHTERERGRDCESGILAILVIERRLAGFDGPGLNGIEGLEPRHDIARRGHIDPETAVGDLPDFAGESLGTAVEEVEALREARRQAPRHLGIGSCGPGWPCRQCGRTERRPGDETPPTDRLRHRPVSLTHRSGAPGSALFPVGVRSQDAAASHASLRGAQRRSNPARDPEWAGSRHARLAVRSQ